jgi:hypothetical protein
MKLIDAMILWGPRESHAHLGLPKVKVVAHAEFNQNLKYDYLAKSMGRCLSGWGAATPLARATHVLGLFHQMILRDNLRPAEVHKDFMEIDEYRDYHERLDDEGEENPFRQAYWAFAAIPEGAPTL